MEEKQTDLQAKYNALRYDIETISAAMPDIIFTRYYDQVPSQQKYVLSLCYDSYKTIEVFCPCLPKAALVQASSLLRLLIDEACTACVLFDHLELLADFIEHYHFRDSIEGKSVSQRIKMTVEHYPQEKLDHRNALEFVDYGWAKPLSENKEDYGLDTIIEATGLLNELKNWRRVCDRSVHLSVQSCQYLHDDAAEALSDELVYIAAVLFDQLSYRFHNATGFDFAFGSKMDYQKFRADFTAVTATRKK
jgi:hypothetical protein